MCVCTFLPYVSFRFFFASLLLQLPIINSDCNHTQRAREAKNKKKKTQSNRQKCWCWSDAMVSRFKLHTKITSNVAKQLKLFPNEHRLIRFSDRIRICLQSVRFFPSFYSFVLFWSAVASLVYSLLFFSSLFASFHSIAIYRRIAQLYCNDIYANYVERSKCFPCAHWKQA